MKLSVLYCHCSVTVERNEVSMNCLFLAVGKIVQVQQYRSTSIAVCFSHTQ